MYKLEFTYRFEAAHRFTKGTSKCATPHGHTWLATLGFSVDADKLNQQDMVEEFENLKKAWKLFITETVDHSFMHHYEDPILSSLKEFVEGFRGLPFPSDPTTEVIAALFLAKGRTLCDNLPFLPSYVSIQETPTNRVTLNLEGLDSVLKRIDSKRFQGWWDSEDYASRELSSAN